MYPNVGSYTIDGWYGKLSHMGLAKGSLDYVFSKYFEARTHSVLVSERDPLFSLVGVCYVPQVTIDITKVCSLFGPLWEVGLRNLLLVSSWWLNQPFEKYARQIGSFSQGSG